MSRPPLPPPTLPLALTPDDAIPDKAPPVVTLPPLAVPNFSAVQLQNGLTLYVATRPGSGYVHVQHVQRRTFSSAREYELALAATHFLSQRPHLDPTLVDRAALEGGALDATVAPKDLGEVLESLEPGDALSEAEVTVLRGIVDTQVRAFTLSAKSRSSSFAARTVYGARYPQGGMALERRAIADSLTAEDFSEAVRARLDPQNSALILVGDVTVKDVEGLVRAHPGEARRSTTAGSLAPGSPRPLDPAIYLLETLSDHAAATLAFQGPPSGSEEEAALDLAYHCLLRGSESRLRRSLRDELGAAKSIYAERSYSDRRRSLTVELAPELTGVGVERLLLELRRMAEEGPDADELERARNALRSDLSVAASRETTLVMWLGRLHQTHDTPEWWLRTDTYLRQLDREKVRRVAKEYLHPDHLSVVVAGQLADLGAQFQWSKHRIVYVRNQ